MQVWDWKDAIEKSETLKGSSKLLLMIMSNYMNSKGDGCYPSVARLAKACVMTERSVYRNLSLAEEAGFLIREKRNIRGQKWASNEYRAIYPKGLNLGSGVTEASPLERDDISVRSRGDTSVR